MAENSNKESWKVLEKGINEFTTTVTIQQFFIVNILNSIDIIAYPECRKARSVGATCVMVGKDAIEQWTDNF